MQIHHEELSDVRRYLENFKDFRLEDREREFELFLRQLSQYKVINQHSQLLEIGTGIGWFPILCQLRGLSCRGLEISPQLIEFARDLGHRHGVEPDVQLGNVEETDLGRDRYDLIIANSVFEHVQHWQAALKAVYDALRPGGVLYFCSTNKFSLRSGEFHFPLYGWLPNRWRYRLRVARQGEDIMKLGIDYNQFTYVQLRRHFKRLGFSRVLDLIEYRDPESLSDPKPWRQRALRTLKRLPPLRHLVLFFSRATFFICIK